MTVLISMTALVYAAARFEHMWTKHNPNINEISRPYEIDGEKIFKLNDIKFRMAFSFKGYFDNEIKDDSRYVKWIVRHLS